MANHPYARAAGDPMFKRHGMKNSLNGLGKYLLLLALLVAAGCTPFQPPPPDYTRWYKDGLSQQDVKGAMRSCGYTNLDGAGDRSHIDVRLTRFYCMKDAGFKRKDDLDMCKLGRVGESPVCEGRR